MINRKIRQDRNRIGTMNESSSSTNQHFIRKLEGIVGKKHVLTQEHKTERYRKGFLVPGREKRWQWYSPALY